MGADFYLFFQFDHETPHLLWMAFKWVFICLHGLYVNIAFVWRLNYDKDCLFSSFLLEWSTVTLYQSQCKEGCHLPVRCRILSVGHTLSYLWEQILTASIRPSSANTGTITLPILLNHFTWPPNVFVQRRKITGDGIALSFYNCNISIPACSFTRVISLFYNWISASTY